MSRIFNSGAVSPNETYVVTPSSPVYNNLKQLTVSSWIYLASFNPNHGQPTLVAKDALGAFSVIFYLWVANSSTAWLAGEVQPNAISPGFSKSSNLMPFNTWTHVAMTFDSAGDGIVHLFINGVEVSYLPGQTAFSGTLVDDSKSGWFFGDDTTDDAFGGNMAEVAIWNSVLTPAQLTAVAASKTGVSDIASANLVGYWHLGGSENPEPDVSGNGNFGSVYPLTQGSNSPGYCC